MGNQKNNEATVALLRQQTGRIPSKKMAQCHVDDGPFVCPTCYYAKGDYSRLSKFHSRNAWVNHSEFRHKVTPPKKEWPLKLRDLMAAAEEGAKMELEEGAEVELEEEGAERD